MHSIYTLRPYHTIPYPTAGPLSAPARPSRRHVADRLVADHSRVPRSRNCPARVIFPGCVEVWTGETQPPYYPPLASPQPAPTPHAPHDRYVVVRPSVRRNRLQTPEAAEAGSKQWRVDSWHSPPARRPRCTGGRCCVCVRWYSSRRLGRRWHPVRSVHAQSRASAGFPARLLHAQRRPCLVPGACPAGPDVRFVSPVASIHRGLIRSGGKGGGARPGRRLGSVRSLVVRLLSHLSLSISRSRACVDRWWATLVINWRAPCRAERGFVVVVVVVVHRPRGDSSRLHRDRDRDD